LCTGGAAPPGPRQLVRGRGETSSRHSVSSSQMTAKGPIRTSRDGREIERDASECLLSLSSASGKAAALQSGGAVHVNAPPPPPPTVLSSIPSNGATHLQASSAMPAGFTQPMHPCSDAMPQHHGSRHSDMHTPAPSTTSANGTSTVISSKASPESFTTSVTARASEQYLYAAPTVNSAPPYTQVVYQGGSHPAGQMHTIAEYGFVTPHGGYIAHPPPPGAIQPLLQVGIPPHVGVHIPVDAAQLSHFSISQLPRPPLPVPHHAIQHAMPGHLVSPSPMPAPPMMQHSMAQQHSMPHQHLLMQSTTARPSSQLKVPGMPSSPPLSVHGQPVQRAHTAIKSDLSDILAQPSSMAVHQPRAPAPHHKGLVLETAKHNRDELSGAGGGSGAGEEEVDLQPLKKVKHNIAERRRTSRLNSLFDDLDSLVMSRPDIFCDAGQRHSKADVLTTGISCVRSVFATIDQLRYQLGISTVTAPPPQGANPSAIGRPLRPLAASLPVSLPPKMQPVTNVTLAGAVGGNIYDPGHNAQPVAIQAARASPCNTKNDSSTGTMAPPMPASQSVAAGCMKSEDEDEDEDEDEGEEEYEEEYEEQ